MRADHPGKRRRPAVLSGRLAFFFFTATESALSLKEAGSAALCVLWQKPETG